MAFFNLRQSYTIITLIFTVSTAYQPVFETERNKSGAQYFIYVFGFCFFTLVITYAIQGFMALMFIYKQMNEQARSTLLDLINNVPDAVILLEPQEKPTLTVTSEDIRSGNIGALFYDMLYCNQRTELIFGNYLTSAGIKLLQTRCLQQVENLTTHHLSSENS